MAELICDTSVLTALHEVNLLRILPALGSRVIVPAAVEQELCQGRKAGYDLPDVSSVDWMLVCLPKMVPELPNAAQLGFGESSVLWLALETPSRVAILDDGVARAVASLLRIPFTGTLGLLVDVKRHGLIAAVAPVLDELARHAFNMSQRVREQVLNAAGELTP